MGTIIGWNEFSKRLEERDEKKAVASTCISFLLRKWNKLKDQIDTLKIHGSSDKARHRIRTLKNEASVIKFAIEALERGVDEDVILSRMKDDREYYKRWER